ncbi:hypothetical protein C8R46DRAFT_1036413 [Mycena filopes]|nr:hypothetical protein C8R46DRAFT_1036413 [Mycena filopes]
MAQALALLAGPNPYVNDGDGFVYEHARVSIAVWNAFQQGKIPWTMVLAEMEIKVGHTNNLGRRLGEYDDSPVGACFLRLVHLSLRHLGAKLRPYRCYGCDTRHREYYDFIRAGGFAGVEKIIRYWLWRMGEVASVRISWSKTESVDTSVRNQSSKSGFREIIAGRGISGKWVVKPRNLAPKLKPKLGISAELKSELKLQFSTCVSAQRKR